MLLKEIADLFTGQTFRYRVDNDPQGECFVIQAKDLDTNNYTFSNTPHRVSLRDIPGNQLLKRYDILLLAKNLNNRAILYDGRFPYAVAVSVFTVIRLKTNYISPKFLCWFLNSKTARDYFATNRVGTNTQNLPKQALELLEVPTPPLEKQEKMLQLFHQYETYKTLQTEYENNLQQLIETLLQKQLNQL